MKSNAIRMLLVATLVLSTVFSNGVLANAAAHSKKTTGIRQIIIQKNALKKGNGKTVQFDWIIPRYMTFSSHYYHMKKGEKIIGMVSVAPSNKKVRMGIANADPHIMYVEGTDLLGYEFTVPKTGDYKFFVKNMTKTKISAIGSYTK